MAFETGLVGTHYWDCNGQSCDAGTLQPWNENKYVASPLYAPQDPDDYGGAIYGEQMWLTGAANDYLSNNFFTDSSESESCHQCILIKNSNSVESEWTAVLMKLNRCPPWSNGCDAQSRHIDVAAPGFDFGGASTASVCGSRDGTHMSGAASTACGSWWQNYSNTKEAGAVCCESLPKATDAQKMLYDGCKLFASWGWKTGNPSGMEFKSIACPARFSSLIADAFNAQGVVGFETGNDGGSGGDTGNNGGGSGDFTCAECPSGNCGDCSWADEGTCSNSGNYGANDASECGLKCCCQFNCNDSDNTGGGNNPGDNPPGDNTGDQTGDETGGGEGGSGDDDDNTTLGDEIKKSDATPAVTHVRHIATSAVGLLIIASLA